MIKKEKENKTVSVEIVKCKKIKEKQDGTLDILLDDGEFLSAYASEVIKHSLCREFQLPMF